jgi:hypothetical protein
MAQGPAVSIYARDNCIAAVGGNHSGKSGGNPGGSQAGNQGSTGMMTERGLAYLVWRDGRPYLAVKGGETPATPEQVEIIRRFSEDLNTALST